MSASIEQYTRSEHALEQSALIALRQALVAAVPDDVPKCDEHRERVLQALLRAQQRAGAAA